MKGLIFAAGIGSRLKPFTNHHPKALAPIGGQPALAWVIRKLANAGCSTIVVNVHHFARQIIDFMETEAPKYPAVEFRISDESDLLLDTGAGLLKALPLLDCREGEDVIIHNADILTDAPLDEMLQFHRKSGADATLLAWDRPTSRYLIFNNDNELCGWVNTKTGETIPACLRESLEDNHRKAFGGVHIVSASIFPLLEHYGRLHPGPFPIVPFYLSIMQQASIKAFTPATPFQWHDIGTPEKLAAANLALQGT